MKTGNKIRYKGVYRLYRNGVPVSETPYNLTDAFGSTPAITVEELELMTTQDIEARAAAMIQAIPGKCNDFEVINNVIYPSASCVDDEDDFMIGQIIDFAGQRGTWDNAKWLECAGQTLAVADYPELYEVIGREWTYDGSVPGDRFNLPDLRTRITLGFDEDDNASPRDSYNTNPYQRTTNCGRVGNYGGRQFAQLGEYEIPSHSHSMLADAGASGGGSDFTQMTGHVTKAREVGGNVSYRLGNSNLEPTLGLTGKKGSGQNHENRQPYAVVTKLIRYI